MKKALILASTLFLSSSILNADINIQAGWQLYGATKNIDLNTFDNQCIDYIWKYDTQGTTPEWQIHVANGVDYAHIITKATSFAKGEGLWIKASSACTVAFDDSSNQSTNDAFESGGTWKGQVYQTVLSPFTGKTWLDRNLGASQTCTALNDPLCYGDYYQWGRATDGHQKAGSMTTTEVAKAVTPSDTLFVIGSTDWTDADSSGAIGSALWSKTDASSICPLGYRVPTYIELNDETIAASTLVLNNTDAFNNFLKIPSSGYRTSDGIVKDQGSIGYFWVNFINQSHSSFSYYLRYAQTTKAVTIGNRAEAFPVRCIKN